jgi:hypothetical protein
MRGGKDGRRVVAADSGAGAKGNLFSAAKVRTWPVVARLAAGIEKDLQGARAHVVVCAGTHMRTRVYKPVARVAEK